VLHERIILPTNKFNLKDFLKKKFEGMFLSTSFVVNRTMKMYEMATAQQIDIMKY